jgi:hypothetical protein
MAAPARGDVRVLPHFETAVFDIDLGFFLVTLPTVDGSDFVTVRRGRLRVNHFCTDGFVAIGASEDRMDGVG